MEIAGAVNADRLVEAVVIESRVVRRDEARPAVLIRHHVTISVLLPLATIGAALDHGDPTQRRTRTRMKHAITVDNMKRLNEPQHGQERSYRPAWQTLERRPREEAVGEPCVEDQVNGRRYRNERSDEGERQMLRCNE